MIYKNILRYEKRVREIIKQNHEEFESQRKRKIKEIKAAKVGIKGEIKGEMN